MKRDEYQSTQNTLIVVRRLIDTLDLQEFIAQIERADATGPFTDPTLYRDAAGELRKIRRLAEAAAKLQECELPSYAEALDDSVAEDARGERSEAQQAASVGFIASGMTVEGEPPPSVRKEKRQDELVTHAGRIADALELLAIRKYTGHRDIDVGATIDLLLRRIVEQ